MKKPRIKKTKTLETNQNDFFLGSTMPRHNNELIEDYLKRLNNQFCHMQFYEKKLLEEIGKNRADRTELLEIMRVICYKHALKIPPHI
jgi:hypothetical protein